MPEKPAKFFVKRIQEKISKRRREWEKRQAFIERKTNGIGKWVDNRGFAWVNSFFAKGLGKEVPEKLAELYNGKTPLDILEDGPGQGYFLAGLKNRLDGLRVKSRISAVSLKKEETLEELKRQGIVKELHYGNAEFFIPKKKFDAIISMFGSIVYTLPRLRKEHLLKFAHSLKKNGLMLVGFTFIEETQGETGAITKALSPEAKRTRNTLGMSLSMEMQGIERAFEKRGFHAKFLHYYGAGNLPNWMLIVKRVK